MGALKPWIIKHIVYPIHGTISGRPILKRAMELERTQWYSLNELKNIQLKKLERILRVARDEVPYYRNLFQRHGIDIKKIHDPDDLRQIPVLTKANIRENSKSLLSNRFRMKDLKRDSTSGSTGENIVFYHDRNCRAWFLGNMLRNNHWAGLEVGEPEIMIWGSSFDLKTTQQLLGKLKTFFTNKFYLSAFDLKVETLGQHFDYLRSKKNALITGYASALYLLAQYMIDHEIRDIKPKAIISSAEMLYDYQRKKIEQAFGCKVFNRYGCREFATISHECEHGNQHVIMERVFVEVAGDREREWGVEPGELLITDLDNEGMPMIRYRIGDMGLLKESHEICPCGRNLVQMQEIQGRVFDIVKTPSGRMLPGTFWTILSKAVTGVRQFQIRQRRLDEIEMLILPDPAFSHQNLPYLQETIKKYCGSDMNIHFRLVDHIPIPPSGKFRYVISEIN